MKTLLLTGLAGSLLAIGCSSPAKSEPESASNGPAASTAAAPASATTSVKPGINDSFLDPNMEIDQMVGRFEVESREIYSQRVAIAAAVGIEPGDDIADVGAGTGLFMELFAEAVGPEGTLYAIDISPGMVEHMTARATQAGLPQVEVRLCSEDSVDLPEASIDLAFICDVYHHFEYPAKSMASIRKALRYGGEVVVLDFERIPGVTREWLMNHVRAGKSEVIAEMNSFGFDLVEEDFDLDLPENYFLRFRKR
jgi:SAM-dependent methyltransferase